MPDVSVRSSGNSSRALTAAVFRALGYVLYLQYKLWARSFHVDPLGRGAYVEITGSDVGDGAGTVLAPEVSLSVGGCNDSVPAAVCGGGRRGPRGLWKVLVEFLERWKRRSERLCRFWEVWPKSQFSHAG